MKVRVKPKDYYSPIFMILFFVIFMTIMSKNAKNACILKQSVLNYLLVSLNCNGGARKWQSVQYVEKKLLLEIN